MIDEKKLIEDFLNNYLVKNNGTWNDAMDRAVELTKTAPKVGEWIPCSERLPSTEKQYKSVLLQLKNSMVVGYINKAGQWFVDSGDGWCADLDDEPIAWQPLPEPYKEGLK